jgi:hypothetical protein
MKRSSPSRIEAKMLSGSELASVATSTTTNHHARAGVSSGRPAASGWARARASHGATAKPTTATTAPIAQKIARLVEQVRLIVSLSPTARKRAVSRTTHAAIPRSSSVQ